jgi:imidazolonepropionase-like amidohydrolase
MVRLTRQQIKYGADWIKIHVTGSLRNQTGEATVWSLDELRAVTETAHGLNTPVLAHCRSAHSTRLAAQSGVDLILHGSYMDEPALEAVQESGAALAPTFTFLANLTDFGSTVGAGSAQVDLFRGEIEATAQMMLRAHSEGVRLLCGSESGFSLTPYGHWHARELELFVSEIGLTPLEAITCATRNGALALRMEEGSVGVLQRGAVADVLVVNGNPATDVSVLSDRTKIEHVFSRGVAVDLDRPWPQRSQLQGEQVGKWSEQLLTQERAGVRPTATTQTQRSEEP